MIDELRMLDTKSSDTALGALGMAPAMSPENHRSHHFA